MGDEEAVAADPLARGVEESGADLSADMDDEGEAFLAEDLTP